jgi:hypothetical protein
MIAFLLLFVTLGTVGYGDLTPVTDIGKHFTVIYIVVGLSMIGGYLATLGKLIDSQKFLDVARRDAGSHRVDRGAGAGTGTAGQLDPSRRSSQGRSRWRMTRE